MRGSLARATFCQHRCGAVGLVARMCADACARFVSAFGREWHGAWPVARSASSNSMTARRVWEHGHRPRIAIRMSWKRKSAYMWMGFQDRFHFGFRARAKTSIGSSWRRGANTSLRLRNEVRVHLGSTLSLLSLNTVRYVGQWPPSQHAPLRNNLYRSPVQISSNLAD